jgi:hypothetical protein
MNESEGGLAASATKMKQANGNTSHKKAEKEAKRSNRARR